MKKLGILIFSAILLFAAECKAQVTYDTVTGTVTDPNGNPFANATLIARLVNAQGLQVSSASTPNGSLYNAKPVQATLSPSGYFSIGLVPNNTLSNPSGTQWQISISSPADSAILTTYPPWNISLSVTITANVDLSSQLSALAESINFMNLRTGQSTLSAVDATARSEAQAAQSTANAALPANGITSSTGGDMNAPGTITAGSMHLPFTPSYCQSLFVPAAGGNFFSTFGMAFPDTCWGAKNDGSTDDTAALNNALATGLSIVIPWDGVAGHCAKTSAALVINANGQQLLGTNPYQGGICPSAPGFNAVQIGNGATTLQNVGIHNLAINYGGTIASGLTATANAFGGNAKGFAVTAGGSGYANTGGIGVNGCGNVQTVWTISSGAVTAIAPASGSVGAGTFATSNTTGTCVPFSPNTWSASMTITAYSSTVVDSNGNVEEAITSGTAGGSAPTWSTVIPKGTTAGGTTTDGTGTWQNMGPNHGWLASATYEKYYNLIVGIGGGTYCDYYQNIGGGTTGSTEPSFSSCTATYSDGTASWVGKGVFGQVSVFGGSNGDSANQGKQGYGIAVLSSGTQTSINTLDIENVIINQMGGGLYLKGVGNSTFMQIYAIHLQDGDSYGVEFQNSGNNSNYASGIHIASCGGAAYLANGVSQNWGFGDMSGCNLESAASAMGSGIEIGQNFSGSVSTGNIENLGGTSVIIDPNLNAQVSLVGYQGDGFRIAAAWPNILNGGALSISAASIFTRGSVDTSIPFVQNTATHATTTRYGSPVGTQFTSATPSDPGAWVQMFVDGSTTAISEFPVAENEGFSAVAQNAGNCLRQFNKGGKDNLWCAGQNNGALFTVDLFNPAAQIFPYTVSGTLTTPYFNLQQTGAGSSNPILEMRQSNASGTDFPALFSQSSTNAGAYVLEMVDTTGGYGFTNSQFTYPHSIVMQQFGIATSSVPLASPSLTMDGAAYDGTASRLFGVTWKIGQLSNTTNPNFSFAPTLTAQGALTGTFLFDMSPFTGGVKMPGTILASATPTVAASQIGLGTTTVASSNCGSLTGAFTCWEINIGGTIHYVPVF